jgi:hypothetical protein
VYTPADSVYVVNSRQQSENKHSVEGRIMQRYYYNMCLANYGGSEAVNLCSKYVEKSTKYSEQK